MSRNPSYPLGKVSSVGSRPRMLSKRVSSFQIPGQTGTKGLAVQSFGKDSLKPKKLKQPVIGTSELTISKYRSETKNKKELLSRSGKQNAESFNKPQYDMAKEAKFDAMLDGNLTDLPPLPRSIVRIFISSTFSDMRAERNALSREVVPKLREYCADLRLDFQLVDLRWGLTEDSQNDHSAEKLCLLEVENCQKVSLGPNFVTILSKRYGGRPLPTEIGVSEFEALKMEADHLGLEGRDLLDVWYRRDDNALPPHYLLQPIRTQYKFFGDHSSGCDDKRVKDKAAWYSTQQALQGILRTVANSLHNSGKLSAVAKHCYFQSVTESEIMRGILEADNSRAHAMFYQREIFGLTGSSLQESIAQKYIAVQTADGQVRVDNDVQRLIDDSVSKIVKHLGKQSCRLFEVKWQSGGIDPQKFPDHEEYIKLFCKSFITDVISLINRAKNDRASLIRQTEYYSTYDEVLHHMTFCNMKCESFCGQTEILHKVKEYILSDSSRCPLTIHAQSGAGKTSVMAMIMKNLSSWIKGDYIGAIRFLGTSPRSVNIYDVLFSVCGQLADSANAIMEPVGVKTMKSLVHYIPRYLRKIASTVKKPIVILLDSIDQLSEKNDVYSMWWLPLTLPPNVHLIISTLPNEHGILANLKKKLPDKECYLEVPLLPQSTGKEIITKYLQIRNRTIREDQTKLLLTTFSQAPSPLYLKLLLDEAVRWHSYNPVNQCILADSIRAAINVLFDRLEKKFGEILVKSALGFITIGLNGISEIELEDALSCHDEVLNDVYRFHDPPVFGIVRIPPVLWARIRYDLKEYLVERLSQGKNTLCWYHRQFIEAATARYVQDSGDLHRIMFEIYQAENGFKKDIYLSHRTKTIPEADRQIVPQPLSVENHRKLECLTYHMKHAASILGDGVAKKQVFCNLRFLSTKIAAFSADYVVKDMEDYLEGTSDEEILIVKNFLDSCKGNMKNPVLFAGSVLAYINPGKYQKYLLDLQTQAKEYLQLHEKPLLIPEFPCLAERCDFQNKENVRAIEGNFTLLASDQDTVLLQTKDNWEEGFHSKSTRPPGQNYICCLKTLEMKGPLSSNFSEFDHHIFKTGMTEVVCSDKTSITLKSHFGSENEVKTQLFGLDKKSKNQIKVFNANSAVTYATVLTFGGNLFLVDLNGQEKPAEFVLGNLAGYSVTNTHCTCGNSIRVFAAGNVEKPSSGKEGFVIYWQSESPSPVGNIDLPHKVEEGLSELAASGNHLVCIGSSREKSEMSVITLKPFELYKTCTISRVLKMKASEVIPMVVLMTDASEIHVFDVCQAAVVQTVEYPGRICAFDVAWDKELILIGNSEGEVYSYSLQSGRIVHSFGAHCTSVRGLWIVGNSILSSGDFSQLKVWNLNDLTKIVENKEEGLVGEVSAISIGINDSCQEIITCCTDEKVKIWSIDGCRMLRSYGIGIRAHHLIIAAQNIAVALDRCSGTLKIFEVDTGCAAFHDIIPRQILAVTVTFDRTEAYVISNEGRLWLHHLALRTGNIKRSFPLQKSFTFKTIDIQLSSSERYLVLQIHCVQEDFDAIKASWKKGGRYNDQTHQHRYAAVDLTQNTGNIQHCFRQLTKIPTLGLTSAPYKGNIVMIASNRHCLYWDIPTGKIDQQMSKGKKLVMIYRPDWAGEDKCKGSNTCFASSNNKEFIAVGSEDGYLVIYGADSGLPVGMKSPATKHSAKVTGAAVSPDSRWVASACQNSVLKLWNSKTAVELFSMQLNANVKQLIFSSDSKHLVVCTVHLDPRVLVFKIHPGRSG